MSVLLFYRLYILFFCVYVLLLAIPMLLFVFFNDTAPTEIYTLSLHDALPILVVLTETIPKLGEKRLPFLTLRLALSVDHQ